MKKKGHGNISEMFNKQSESSKIVSPTVTCPFETKKDSEIIEK